MYRVLIVDDQYFALLGLQQGVDWSALSVSDVCLAENVDQAIAVLEQQPVDLLICDIEMPGKSGLELLAWVKQSAPGTLTIMLTCHADFEYAQRAIYHGAFHYLLKPVDYEELMKISREALFEISKQRAAAVRGPDPEVPETVGASAPLLVERFWQDILSQRAAPVLESLTLPANTYNLDLQPGDRYFLALLGLEQWKENLSARDETIMEYALRNMADELLLSGLEGTVLQDQVGHNLAVIYVRGDMNAVRHTLEQNGRTFLDTCGRLLHCSLSIYISAGVPLSGIMSAYTNVTEREQRNLNRSRQVFGPEDQAYSRDQPLAPVPQAAPMHIFGEWATLLELGELEELERRVTLWFSGIGPGRWTSELHRQLIHGILFIVHTVLAKKAYPHTPQRS